MADEARLFLNVYLIYNRLGEGDPIMQAKALGLALSVALAGCQTQETSGHWVDVPPVAGADYAVQMQNTVGHDLDDKQNRERVALDYKKTQCPSARVVKEAVSGTGTSDGRPTRIYTVYVKC
ncbi:hypothetical protein [Rhizobium indicum]|uniref:Uncharacterized protein n=1 Tax=Rhizobium indicum TaxID=2583231 RepID=A0ABX6PJB3_9HYPH|nr:hypothetical protein [Rhizobium indicum]QKK18661.1 hypothetical protein FFM53_020345 [Rhizobium indicum]